MFGTTGLQLVGTRVFSMRCTPVTQANECLGSPSVLELASVEKGLEFYGFLENVFVKKLKPNLQEMLKSR